MNKYGHKEPVQQRKDQSRVYKFITGKHTPTAHGLPTAWCLGSPVSMATGWYHSQNYGRRDILSAHPLRHGERVRLRLYADPYILCMAGGFQRRLERLNRYGTVGMWTWTQPPGGDGCSYHPVASGSGGTSVQRIYTVNSNHRPSRPQELLIKEGKEKVDQLQQDWWF